MITIKMAVVPFNYLNKFISEIYPFTEKELEAYVYNLNFKHLSKNRNIKWSYALIKQFEDLWDWDSLKENKSVFNKLTLGLVFPHRIELMDCNCAYKLDFCEREECIKNVENFLNASSLMDEDAELFSKVSMMCETTLIDEELLKDIYSSENPEAILSLKSASYNS